MMDVQRVKQILRNYLSGNSSPKEKERVDNWYQSFEAGAGKNFSEEEEDLVKHEIWSRIEPVVSGKTPRSISLLSVLLRIAALIVLISGITWILIQRFDRIPYQKSLYSEIYTGPGERKNITMSDGTLLVVNAGSHIRVQNNFSLERRVEILDGEVYFDVKKDAVRPFIITTGAMTTRVLGTAFNISAYRDISKMSVGVIRGKVRVSSKGRILQVLGKNDQLTYNKKKNTFKVGAVESGLLSWREGKLVLNDISFNDMAVLMEKNFGVKIYGEASLLKANRYTTELTTIMGAEKAMEVLAAIHNLKVKRSGNIFYLSK